MKRTHSRRRAWRDLLTQTTINPTGGINPSGADGLRIYVTNLGQVQVLYKNAGQLFDQNTTDTSTSLYNGIMLAVGNKVVTPVNVIIDASVTDATFKSQGAQTLTGAGTAASPWVVTTTMYYDVDGNNAYGAATDFQVVVKTSYVNGNGYFTQTVTVTPPSTNTGVVKLYQTADTMLGGQDNGTGTSTAIGGNVSAIGVLGANTGAGTNIYIAETQGGADMTRTYAGVYNGANLYANGINNGGDIVNTLDTSNIDMGFGAQWTLGAITAPTTVSYHIAFTGETTLDLDANNSTAAGSGYATSYSVGGSAVGVVELGSRSHEYHWGPERVDRLACKCANGRRADDLRNAADGHYRVRSRHLVDHALRSGHRGGLRARLVNGSLQHHVACRVDAIRGHATDEPGNRRQQYRAGVDLNPHHCADH